jgi:hypothetical protein
MGRFEQPDFSRGDPNTIGGYRAAHGRPPAFEASDGNPYSVEAVADETPQGRYAAYLLFVRWRSTDPVAAGHVETDYLAFAPTEQEALEELGSMTLKTARDRLNELLAARQSGDSDRRNGRHH